MRNKLEGPSAVVVKYIFIDLSEVHMILTNQKLAMVFTLNSWQFWVNSSFRKYLHDIKPPQISKF